MEPPVLPELLLKSLEGVKGFGREAFIDAHVSGAQVVSVRFNPSKIAGDEHIFTNSSRVPWSTHGYYLPSRPLFVFDPLLHAGGYYVQEASGMFLEQCVRQTTDLSLPLRVLDLCAAPGGKSTLLQSLINTDSLLVSNEVIRTRIPVLKENIAKWGAVNRLVSCNDPEDFGALENYFDLVVVDAPCSGSGLFRRDPAAIKEWSPGAVEICRQRQERILSGVYPSLKRDGVWIYSTCSYSAEENEQVCDWICRSFRVTSLRLQLPANWNIVETRSEEKGAYGYRFYPDRIKGEGFFIACFRKEEGGRTFEQRSGRNLPAKLASAGRAMVQPWLENAASLDLCERRGRTEKEVFAFPAALREDLASLAAHLHVKMAGVQVGKLAGGELIPAHELALSGLLSSKPVRISLKKEQALQYLRKEEVDLGHTIRGWTIVEYEGLSLGWVKILQNRVNNYYPKEWRILKTAID